MGVGVGGMEVGLKVGDGLGVGVDESLEPVVGVTDGGFKSGKIG